MKRNLLTVPAQAFAIPTRNISPFHAIIWTTSVPSNLNTPESLGNEENTKEEVQPPSRYCRDTTRLGNKKNRISKGHFFSACKLSNNEVLKVKIRLIPMRPMNS